MSKFKTLKEPLNNTYSSYPYRVPVNIKALQHTRIKELQVRMMRWSAWVKDNRIPNKELDKDKWQHRFTFTLRCQRRAGKLTEEELKMLNRLWKVYNQHGTK
jgi:hypothetical protein